MIKGVIDTIDDKDNIQYAMDTARDIAYLKEYDKSKRSNLSDIFIEQLANSLRTSVDSLKTSVKNKINKYSVIKERLRLNKQKDDSQETISMTRLEKEVKSGKMTIQKMDKNMPRVRDSINMSFNTLLLRQLESHLNYKISGHDGMQYQPQFYKTISDSKNNPILNIDFMSDDNKQSERTSYNNSLSKAKELQDKVYEKILNDVKDLLNLEKYSNYETPLELVNYMQEINNNEDNVEREGFDEDIKFTLQVLKDYYKGN